VRCALAATVRGRLTLGEMTLYLVAFRQGQQSFQSILTALGSMYEDRTVSGDTMTVNARSTNAPRESVTRIEGRYTPGWVSQVIASDSFQAYLSTRKEEIVDPLLRGAVEESFKGLVLQSMAALRRKLEANPTDDLALEVFKNSARALGYGARVQVDARVQHTHSLIGVLTGLPPVERVVAQEPLALQQSA